MRNKQPILPTQVGVLPTIFDERTRDYARQMQYSNWAGYKTALIYDDIVTEYAAIRNQCAIIDICPMYKYKITGDDSLAFINKLMTRDNSKLAVNHVAYNIWCNEYGFIIDDGTLFNLGNGVYWLCCQEPQLSWLNLNKVGFAVDIEDISQKIPALALQGPTSFAVLNNAGFDIGHLKPFGIWQGDGVMISRTGFTGDLGYEIWCLGDPLALWDKLMQAGQHLGITPTGMQALDMARIEAGFLAVNVDIQGAHHASRLDRGRTPWEANLGWLIPKNYTDKGFFNGKDAIYASQNKERMKLVAVDIQYNKNATDSLIYYRKNEWIGHLTSALWSPTLKRNIGYAEIKAPYFANHWAHIDTEIYHPAEGQFIRIWAKLTPTPRPFFNPARKTQTPPARF